MSSGKGYRSGSQAASEEIPCSSKWYLTPLNAFSIGADVMMETVWPALTNARKILGAFARPLPTTNA